MNIDNIKNLISQNNADAWVIYDFGSNNPVFKALFGHAFLTRKAFVIIPHQGENIIICHAIDKTALERSCQLEDFTVTTYKTWENLMLLLENELKKYNTVLMEISENGLLPRCSYVDYGTASLIASYVTIKSSADAMHAVAAILDEESIQWQRNSAATVELIKNEAFNYIFEALRKQDRISEYEVQRFIVKRFEEEGMSTDDPPIVATTHNTNNPHYEPSKNKTSFIYKGDLILIDLWAKKVGSPKSVFGDITWMGYAGQTVPEKYQEIFDIVKNAISKTLSFIEARLAEGKLQGYEIDQFCRDIIEAEGYGRYFIHRTGHSLSVGDSCHGIGLNIDNYETHETRYLVDGTAFSIEPGIYLDDFGVREEINVIIIDNKPYVSTAIQENIITMP